MGEGSGVRSGGGTPAGEELSGKLWGQGVRVFGRGRGGVGQPGLKKLHSRLIAHHGSAPARFPRYSLR